MSRVCVLDSWTSVHIKMHTYIHLKIEHWNTRQDGCSVSGATSHISQSSLENLGVLLPQQIEKYKKKTNPKHYFNSYPKHEHCKEVFSVLELQNMHVCISMWPPTYTSMNNKSIIDRDSFQHQLSYAGSYVSHSGCTYSPACFSFFQYLHLIWPRKKGAQIMAVFIFSQLSETN